MAIKGKTASKKKVAPKAKLVAKAAVKPTKKVSAKATRKPSAKTRKPATKATATKATAAKKGIAAAPKKTANEPTGIWKLLEQKEAQRKAHEAERAGAHWNENRNAGAGKHQGFSRFAGPRRRAA